MPTERWTASRTLTLFALLVALGVAAAWPWTRFAYAGSHFEDQGIDIVNHAILVHQVSVPGGRTAHALGGHVNYPVASHRLAAAALPLFDGNPLLALRFAAAAAMVVLTAAPFVLLCRVLPVGPALIALAVWEFACLALKVSGFNHFMPAAVYNYSRAVGTAAWWAGLVFLAAAPAAGWRRYACWAAAVGLACFAMACHVAPGGVAFATLGLYACYGFARDRRADFAALAAAAGLAGAGMVFGTDVWVYMKTNAAADGWLPVGPWPVLFLWVPVLVVACVRPGTGLLARPPARPPANAPRPMLEPILTAGLIGAGLFQAYLGYKLVRGECAPYGFKSLFFFTFPLAAFLATVWVARGFQPGGRLAGFRWPAASRRLVVPAALALTAGLAACVARLDRGLNWQVRVAAYDHNSDRARPDPATLPHQAAEALRPVAASAQGYYYVDPKQPFGAYYATVVGLGMDRDVAEACWEARGRDTIARLREFPTVAGVLVPRGVDPAAATAVPLRVEEAGPFWKCRFEPFK